jgi:hypothetical protein
MMKKLSSLIALCALFVGFGAVAAHAADSDIVKSQTFFFNGTCTGTDQVFNRPFNPTFTGKIIGGDIIVFQNPNNGINYAFAGVAGGTNIILWAGPQQTHVTANFGFPGFDTTSQVFNPGGFTVATTTQIVFDLSCNSGPWQTFLTLWYIQNT